MNTYDTKITNIILAIIESTPSKISHFSTAYQSSSTDSFEDMAEGNRKAETLEYQIFKMTDYYADYINTCLSLDNIHVDKDTVLSSLLKIVPVKLYDSLTESGNIKDKLLETSNFLDPNNMPDKENIRISSESHFFAYVTAYFVNDLFSKLSLDYYED